MLRIVSDADTKTDEGKKEEEDKFKAFAGRGRRLDNKANSKPSTQPESSSSTRNTNVEAAKSTFDRGGARANKFSKNKSLVAFNGKANKF